MSPGSDVATHLLLYLDLGDIVTKGLAVEHGRIHHFHFPSVVAHRLLDGKAPETRLLLDERDAMQRPEGFDPKSYPRTRSYPREDAYREGIPAVPRARYAGQIAVALGADRKSLGSHPTEENVDALVHKALSKSAEGCSSVEVVFVSDTGVKAEVIGRYARSSPRTVRFLKWKVRGREPVPMELDLRCRVVDSAACAVAALPPDVDLRRERRLLSIDVGHTRTKLAFVSTDGCERQEQIDGLGVSVCVRRILRDGQDQGLVEDEYAVTAALERAHDRIEVAGRVFDVGRMFESARRDLEGELARAVRRALVDDYGRRGETCKAVAVVGGGAPVVGAGLVGRLVAEDLAVRTTWVADDTKFHLLEGARRLDERRP